MGHKDLLNEIKDQLGNKASTLVQTGMVVGLGSGSTATFFIQHLIKRVKEEKLIIDTVASSTHSSQLAKAGGLKVYDIDHVSQIDLTVDGADEIDPKKRMIKGGGGAHLREKIVAYASKTLVILVDETKLCDRLGKHKIPVEVTPFGAKKTEGHLQDLNYQTEWRKDKKGDLYLTDNHHYLIDLSPNHPLQDPEKEDRKIKEIPGVVETGLFLHFTPTVFVGHLDRSITCWD